MRKSAIWHDKRAPNLAARRRAHRAAGNGHLAVCIRVNGLNEKPNLNEKMAELNAIGATNCFVVRTFALVGHSNFSAFWSVARREDLARVVAVLNKKVAKRGKRAGRLSEAMNKKNWRPTANVCPNIAAALSPASLASARGRSPTRRRQSCRLLRDPSV